jgi:hypothetical protein
MMRYDTARGGVPLLNGCRCLGTRRDARDVDFFQTAPSRMRAAIAREFLLRIPQSARRAPHPGARSDCVDSLLLTRLP